MIVESQVDPLNQVSAFSEVAYNFGFVDALQRQKMEALQVKAQALIREEKWVEVRAYVLVEWPSELIFTTRRMMLILT